MAPNTLTPLRSRRKPAATTPTEPVGELIWELFSASTYLEKIRKAWGHSLGISGPQWFIMMAIEILDVGHGVAVGEVSAKLHVNSTFVTAQTKQLEKLGYINREPSTVDARVVLLSLTQQAIKTIRSFSDRREHVNEMIFGHLSSKELRDVLEKLKGIRLRMEKAVLMIEE